MSDLIFAKLINWLVLFKAGLIDKVLLNLLSSGNARTKQHDVRDYLKCARFNLTLVNLFTGNARTNPDNCTEYL